MRTRTLMRTSNYVRRQMIQNLNTKKLPSKRTIKVSAVDPLISIKVILDYKRMLPNYGKRLAKEKKVIIRFANKGHALNILNNNNINNNNNNNNYYYYFYYYYYYYHYHYYYYYYYRDSCKVDLSELDFPADSTLFFKPNL